MTNEAPCCRLAGKIKHVHHGPPNNRVTLPHARPRPEYLTPLSRWIDKQLRRDGHD